MNTNPHDDTWANPSNEPQTTTERSPMNYSTGKLVRSREKMIAGVCAGIAQSTGIDVGLVRIAAVILAFVTSGVALAVYAAAWAVLPVEGEQGTALDSLIETGKKQYGDYKIKRDTSMPSSQPGPTQTRETFDPYQD